MTTRSFLVVLASLSAFAGLGNACGGGASFAPPTDAGAASDDAPDGTPPPLPDDRLATTTSPIRCLTLGRGMIYFATDSTLYELSSTESPQIVVARVENRKQISACVAGSLNEVAFADGDIFRFDYKLVRLGELGGHPRLVADGLDYVATSADSTPSMARSFYTLRPGSAETLLTAESVGGGTRIVVGVASRPAFVAVYAPGEPGETQLFRVGASLGAHELADYLPGRVEGLALAGAFVYGGVRGANGAPGGLVEFRLEGPRIPRGPIAAMANPPDGYDPALAVRDDVLFWADGARIRTSVDRPETLFTAPAPIVALAVDDTHVYYATAAPDSRIGRIRRAAR